MAQTGHTIISSRSENRTSKSGKPVYDHNINSSRSTIIGNSCFYLVFDNHSPNIGKHGSGKEHQPIQTEGPASSIAIAIT